MTARDEFETVAMHLKEISRIASRHGIRDMMRLGVLKNIVVAQHLKHKLVFGRPFNAYEQDRKASYLTALEGNRFQTGMVGPEEVASFEADAFYFVVFNTECQFEIVRIHRLSRRKFMAEAQRQIKIKNKKAANVSLSETWLKKNAEMVCGTMPEIDLSQK